MTTLAFLLAAVVLAIEVVLFPAGGSTRARTEEIDELFALFGTRPPAALAEAVRERTVALQRGGAAAGALGAFGGASFLAATGVDDFGSVFWVIVTAALAGNAVGAALAAARFELARSAAAAAATTAIPVAAETRAAAPAPAPATATAATAAAASAATTATTARPTGGAWPVPGRSVGHSLSALDRWLGWAAVGLAVVVFVVNLVLGAVETSSGLGLLPESTGVLVEIAIAMVIFAELVSRWLAGRPRVLSVTSGTTGTSATSATSALEAAPETALAWDDAVLGLTLRWIYRAPVLIGAAALAAMGQVPAVLTRDDALVGAIHVATTVAAGLLVVAWTLPRRASALRLVQAVAS